MSKPKERSELFLSCDLVGSTSYKQRTRRPDAGDEIPWQQTFMEFYRTFPQLVAQKQVTATTGIKFDLWKPIGDELVMTVHVQDEHQVYEAVFLWIDALGEYGAKLEPVGMGTKGGAFIATFPGPDSEVAVPRHPIEDTSGLGVVPLNDRAFNGPPDHGAYVFDYFGPSIDTGFRILSTATPRYFPLSTEVAWAMCASKSQETVGLEALTYRGGHEMKGVWGGRDYPLFAIDRMSDDEVNKSLGAITSGGPPDVRQFIALFKSCSRAPGWPSAIYLPKAGDKLLQQRPVDPLERLRADNELDGAEEPASEVSNLGDGSVEQLPALEES